MHCRPRAEAHVAVGPLAPAQRPAEHGGAVGDEALVVVVVVVGLAGADDGRQETRRGVARPAVAERLRQFVTVASFGVISYKSARRVPRQTGRRAIGSLDLAMISSRPPSSSPRSRHDLPRSRHDLVTTSLDLQVPRENQLRAINVLEHILEHRGEIFQYAPPVLTQLNVTQLNVTH